MIRGAREHNLKGVDLDIPRGRLVVFTGPSGSGKTSLAMDTLHAEGQRRFVESLSAYARQFLGQMERPRLDQIRGLSPTIAIEQRSAVGTPRSTVGTIAEISDHLRVLYARCGVQHCPGCGAVLVGHSAQEMVRNLLGEADGTRVVLLAPQVRRRRGSQAEVLAALRKQGLVRVRVDGQLQPLDGLPPLDARRLHSIEAVVDRVVIRGEASGQGGEEDAASGLSARLTDSVETALRLGDGVLVAWFSDRDEERALSERVACLECDRRLPDLSPQSFSFNSPQGMCRACQGLGVTGAGSGRRGERQDDYSAVEQTTCDACLGDRLREESRHVHVASRTLPEVLALNVSQATGWAQGLVGELPAELRPVAVELMNEVGTRLSLLSQLGLGYLSLDRPGPSLSGGEAQRIRLAGQLGSELSGVIYVLDEPSVGLHPRDNERLLATLERLRDLGNTVIVVEHDRETIERADWVADFGPGAGARGGEVVASGTPEDIILASRSLTGRYLRGDLVVARRDQPRPVVGQGQLVIRGAREHNLAGFDARFPLGVLIGVSGVSGAGKSTLVNDILHPALVQRRRGHGARQPGAYARLEGAGQVDRVVRIDQRPIGRTPRSNPATYVKLLDPIRRFFASLPEARVYGYGPGRFSFNVKGGRCEACRGDGLRRIEMHFLPDVYVRCEECRGRRFNEATLRVRYRGLSIADVLDLTVREALALFRRHPRVFKLLQTLDEVGLDYLTLGQPSNTLSGGEAQRVKLSRELGRADTGSTLYLLDEPSTGLHLDDVRRLLALLQRLVDAGNTVVVIEHHLDILKCCDWLLDLGPEGGEAGGQLLCSGSPEEVAACPQSYTGRLLAPLL